MLTGARRLRADAFVLSRSQRKTLKRLCHYLQVDIPQSSPPGSLLDMVLGALDDCSRFAMEFVSPTASASDPTIFALYRRYQVAVHGDDEQDVDRQQFRAFLCDTPLLVRMRHRSPLTVSHPAAQAEALDDDEPTYGSRHIYYRIDGQVVAVSVVDILPLCLSSVYLF